MNHNAAPTRMIITSQATVWMRRSQSICGLVTKAAK